MRVVVLNDGETYTDMQGCMILFVPDDIVDDNVDRYVKSYSHTGVRVSEAFAEWAKPR